MPTTDTNAAHRRATAFVAGAVVLCVPLIGTNIPTPLYAYERVFGFSRS